MIVKRGLPILLLCSVLILIFISYVEKNFQFKKVKQFQRVSFHHLLPNSEKLLNLKDFRYVINRKCNATFLTWIITSYAGNPMARSALRRAYPEEELQELGIERVFLLGVLDEKAEHTTRISQNAIKNEAQRFNDIVQGNFFEAYRNLTYKHLMGLTWAAHNCNQAPYIMKMDDDIVLNLYYILDVLRNTNDTDNILMGYVLKNMTPVREPANKWFVTQDEFASDAYPSFLSGWLYMTGQKTAVKLINHARTYQKYFWIDDVFITGILRDELGIRMRDIHEIYTTDYRYLNCCIKDQKKRLRCDYAIGPNGGDTELQVRYQSFVNFCRVYCVPRTKKFSVNNTCIVAYKEPSWDKGNAEIHPIEIL